MNALKYLITGCLTSVLWVGCSEEYVYNTRTVSDMELVGTNEDGTLLLSRGESGKVQIKMLPVDATDKSDYSFRYESSDEGVFMVDSLGAIESVEVGEAELTVQAVNNPALSKTCKVIVQPNWIRTIELSPDYRECSLVVGNTLDLGSAVTIKPENADNPALIYTSSNTEIAEVDEKGLVTAKAVGDVEIVIQAADGGGAMTSSFIHVTDELKGDFVRSQWEVTTSHPYVPDNDGGIGSPEAILDGDYDTFLSLRKPGKGAETPAGDTLYFTIDMKEANPFTYFKWHYRGNNSSVNLRVSELDLLGSNDGEHFEEIQKGITLDTSTPASSGEKIVLDKKVSYRYVRFVLLGYNNGGTAVQVSEVYIGNE